MSEDLKKEFRTLLEEVRSKLITVETAMQQIDMWLMDSKPSLNEKQKP